MSEKIMRNGFTLVELVIVLSIITIISAIILPNFLGTTDKARLRADVQSARILQNAADLYDAEQAAPLPRTNAGDDIGKLQEKGYIPGDAASIQTVDAVWHYDNKKLKVNISGCTAEIKALHDKLGAQEQSMITK